MASRGLSKRIIDLHTKNVRPKLIAAKLRTTPAYVSLVIHRNRRPEQVRRRKRPYGQLTTEALRLADLGLKPAAIAERLGTTPGSVSVLLHKKRVPKVPKAESVPKVRLTPPLGDFRRAA